MHDTMPEDEADTLTSSWSNEETTEGMVEKQSRKSHEKLNRCIEGIICNASLLHYLVSSKCEHERETMLQ